MTPTQRLAAAIGGTLPDSLKAAIDAALAAGLTRQEILRRVRRTARRCGSSGLTTSAVECYLESKET
jgi:hypothetical protein